MVRSPRRTSRNPAGSSRFQRHSRSGSLLRSDSRGRDRLADRTPAARAWSARHRRRSDRGGCHCGRGARAALAERARRDAVVHARRHLAGPERVVRVAGRHTREPASRFARPGRACGRRGAHGLGCLEGAPHGQLRVLRPQRPCAARRARPVPAHDRLRLRRRRGARREHRRRPADAGGRDGGLDRLHGAPHEPREPGVPLDRRGRRDRRPVRHLLGAGLRRWGERGWSTAAGAPSSSSRAAPAGSPSGAARGTSRSARLAAEAAVDRRLAFRHRHAVIRRSDPCIDRSTSDHRDRQCHHRAGGRAGRPRRSAAQAAPDPARQ